MGLPLMNLWSRQPNPHNFQHQHQPVSHLTRSHTSQVPQRLAMALLCSNKVFLNKCNLLPRNSNNLSHRVRHKVSPLRHNKRHPLPFSRSVRASRVINNLRALPHSNNNNTLSTDFLHTSTNSPHNLLSKAKPINSLKHRSRLNPSRVNNPLHTSAKQTLRPISIHPPRLLVGKARIARMVPLASVTNNSTNSNIKVNIRHKPKGKDNNKTIWVDLEETMVMVTTSG